MLLCLMGCVPHNGVIDCNISMSENSGAHLKDRLKVDVFVVEVHRNVLELSDLSQTVCTDISCGLLHLNQCIHYSLDSSHLHLNGLLC